MGKMKRFIELTAKAVVNKWSCDIIKVKDKVSHFGLMET